MSSIIFGVVLDKMNKLEGKDKKWKNINLQEKLFILNLA
jgi:hypothetical protein